MTTASYALLTELDAPYHLIANLLRLRVGKKYSAYPFVDLDEKRKIIHKIKDLEKRLLEAQGEANEKLQKDLKRRERHLKSLFFSTSNQKIEIIQKLEKEVDIETLNLSPEADTYYISDIFKEYYYSEIRNAIFHSDFTLKNDNFIFGRSKVEINGNEMSTLSFHVLRGLYKKALAFYDAFRHLDFSIRSKLALLPNIHINDMEDKSIIEFVAKDNLLCGFVIHWPNGREARTSPVSSASR